MPTKLSPLAPDGFTTDRLDVQQWSDRITKPDGKRDLIAALKSIMTPTVLADLPPSMQLSRAKGAIAAWIAARAGESDVYTISEKNGDLIGLLILAIPNPQAPRPEVHLGYLLAQTAWENGYASELVLSLVQTLQHSTPLRLIGGVARRNPASARVLIKAGFVLQPGQAETETDSFALTLE